MIEQAGPAGPAGPGRSGRRGWRARLRGLSLTVKITYAMAAQRTVRRVFGAVTQRELAAGVALMDGG
jgi:hypothetical protein